MRGKKGQYAGAFYHVLNRGNYRDWMFESEGARKSFLKCLESAGGLVDKPKGRKLYRDYLDWLSESEPTRKMLGFEKMGRGWAKGTKEF